MEDALLFTVNTCKAVVSHVAIKCVGAISLLIATYSFNGVRYTVLISIGMLVIIDYITALLAEIKKFSKDKEKDDLSQIISFFKMRSFKGAVQAFVYALMVATGSFTEIIIGGKLDLPITEGIASLIAITQAISILENIGNAGYVIPKKLISKLKDLKEES